jgi:hypothetical protein
MAELLLFAWDHSTQSVPKPSLRQIAELPKRYDVVTAQPDGWRWGSAELGHPWFRILACPGAMETDIEPMLSPLLPERDMDDNPTTHWQYRGFYPHLGHQLVPADLQDWFCDDTRAAPRYVLPTPFVVTIAAIKTARSPIVIPHGGER